MARGVKKTTTCRIAELDVKIQKKQDAIKALQSQRKQLKLAQQAEVAAQIIQTANQKGISVDEVLKLIK